MSTEQYEQSRTCDNCGFEETRLLNELSAAFEETRVWGEPCPKCGSTCFGESCSTPALSRSILEVWASNDELYFSQQDEDLVIASKDNLELILEFLDYSSTDIWKRRVLASALYVLWYNAYPKTSNVVGFTFVYEAPTSCESNSTLEEYEDELDLLSSEESNFCSFQQVSPEHFYDEEFALKVASEINKRVPLFIELGAEKASEFGEPLWYLSNYVRNAFEKYAVQKHS
ncbi:hypothetical protein RIVM261_077650 [Rivularia sp. IAM M-261]|nr:hypothetical protein RIVM261_077650 [Rivularia sp. IAM M-261]